MAASFDLVSLAELKQYLGLPANPSATDAAYSALITGVSAFVATYCGRTFERTLYSNEARDGTGTTMLVLPQWPIVDISALSFAGRDWTATDNVNTLGFQFENRTVYVTGGVRFPFVRRAVRVTYTAGYVLPEDAPADLKIAVMETVVAKFNKRNTPEVAARTIANETISYMMQQAPSSAMLVFDTYKNVVPL